MGSLSQGTWRAARKAGGIDVGASSACGARCLNRCNWKRVRASAIGLALPQIEVAVKENEWRNANNAKQRNKTNGSLEVPEDRTATTDSLSHEKLTGGESH